MTSASDATSDSAVDIEEVVVIGTGFIGLPLALVLAREGKTVYGVDIDENLVDAINDGTLQLNERRVQELLDDESVQQNLVAQTTPTTGDAFVISVPTPLSEPEKSPDLTYLEGAIDSILPYLESGNLVNIESTVPPLTTGEVIVPVLEDAGFEPGVDVNVTHSPERILPGNVFEEIVHNDRVIGGYTPECSRRAAGIYEPFLEGEIYHTDLVAAELCKLMENTFRDVNIALANEFAMIGENLDVDISEVIDLSNNHPRVDILRPGIGVGGHCLPVDPWFLNEVDPEHTNLITTARRLNDMMPDIAARKVRRAVSDHVDPTIVALGATYKPNTYDQRNSPASQIVADLESDGYDVRHYDPHVEGMAYTDLRSVVESEDADVLLQLVPHDEVVADIDELRDWLEARDVTVLTFGTGNPIDPVTHG